MIPNELRPYFWDIDLESFKPQDHAEYTIERILELGDSQAFTWLQENFSDDQIKAVVRGNRRLSAKSANFWALVYDIPENQVALTTGAKMIEEWHPEVLTAQTQKTLSMLAGRPELRRFYLAGGTALALQWGHRTSVDLDFFSDDKIDEDSLLANLQAIPETSVVSKANETLHLHINSTKVSFLGYHYKVLYEFQFYMGIAVADPRDIAAMKLSAVASRGTKRDFVDLYVLSQRFGLTEIFRVFERKFAQVAFNDLHLMKSLT